MQMDINKKMRNGIFTMILGSHANLLESYIYIVLVMLIIAHSAVPVHNVKSLMLLLDISLTILINDHASTGGFTKWIIQCRNTL